MVFDPNTLCWVDDREMYSSCESSDHYYIPHRTEQNKHASSYIRPEPSSCIRNRIGFWQTAWDKFQYFVPVLGGMILGLGLVSGLDWVDSMYSIRAKAKAYFFGVSEVLAKNESMPRYERDFLHETPASPTTLTIICCVCGSLLDASHFRHFRSFDCCCPNCGSNLHVENNN